MAEEKVVDFRSLGLKNSVKDLFVTTKLSVPPAPITSYPLHCGVSYKQGSEEQEVIRASVKARENAYCPYSQFKVGSAVRVATGTIFTGCNIENSAYPVTICAERTAIAKAVSEGNTKLISIAVSGLLESSSTFVFPCGSCRQFIAEFAKDKDVPIYLVKPELKNVFVTSLKQLLPHDFHF